MNNQKPGIILEYKESAQEFANQFFELWITPEVIKRQEAGELERPLRFLAAQIIFYPDERNPEIRINSEAKIYAIPRYKEGVTKEIGDTVWDHEIEGVEDFVLAEDEDQDQDCGYVVIVKIGGRWLLAFDVRYNKELARKHIAKAKEFIEVAEAAFKKGLFSPFIDNLFSAAELTAKAILLPHDMTMRENKSHDRVKVQFNNFIALGNLKPKYQEVFEQLRELRKPARYADYDIKIDISEEEKEAMLRTVEEMMDVSQRMISSRGNEELTWSQSREN